MNISTKQYAQALFDLTDGKSEHDVLNVVKKFAKQLRKNCQLKNADKIVENFLELYNKAHGIIGIEVIVHQNMPSDILENVKKLVKERYKAKEVEMNIVVDEKIKGGIIIKVGDEILDGSIGGRLERLKKELVN